MSVYFLKRTRGYPIVYFRKDMNRIDFKKSRGLIAAKLKMANKIKVVTDCTFNKDLVSINISMSLGYRRDLLLKSLTFHGL